MTIYRTRRGFLGSYAILSYVMWSQTPVEQHRLAVSDDANAAFDAWDGLGLHNQCISWLNSTPRTTAVSASNALLP